MKKFCTQAGKSADEYKLDHHRLQRRFDEMSVTLIKAMKLENSEKMSLEQELVRM